MTVSDIIKDNMTTDNKPRFIWIRNGAKTGYYINVNQIVSVEEVNGSHGFVFTTAPNQQVIFLTKWDTADNVIGKIHALLAQKDPS